jgi:anaerobic selenocysteine-containing dehydrogenase
VNANKFKQQLENANLGKADTTILVKKSICTICDPLSQCGLNLYVKDGQIIKVEGSKENPRNEGTLCSKGSATRQYVYSPERLKTPLQRVGPRGSGEYRPISWNEAMEQIARKLKGYKQDFGPESVAFYCGYTKWLRPFLKRLAHSFGSPNYLTESSTCAEAMNMAQKLNFGSTTTPDIKNSECLMVWSANPFHTNTTLARKILDAKDRGMKIIVIDPRVTPMVSQADIHLQLKPGTDGALALAMAHVILEEKLYDQHFVHNFTLGFVEYMEYVKEYTTEVGERITGVPAEKIRRAARLYASTKPAAIMPSAAPVVHHTNGVQNYRAVFALIALTGNYDVSGGNIVDPASFLNIPAGFLSNSQKFAQSKRWADMASRIGEDKFPVWGELVDQGQAMNLAHQIQTGKPYPIKALLAFGINHRMWPDSNHMLETLGMLDFIVNVDIFLTDSSKWADIILPACTSVERSELRCYPERYIIYTQPAISPLYDSRSDAEIIYELAAKLNLKDPLFEAGYEESLKYILEPSGVTLEELKRHPEGMVVPNPMPKREKKYLTQGFNTPSGKMEFTSLVLKKYSSDRGYHALPFYQAPLSSYEQTPDSAKEFPFILNTGSRLPMFIHSRTFRLPWTRMLRPEPSADINHKDATQLGIVQGDLIRISTPKNSIQVKANLTQMVQPGVIHMYHAYPKADVNTLIEADYLDPISGFPGFKALLCKVEK